MPVKAFDYLNAGLPIINSLGRDLGELIKNHRIGLQYIAEDPESMLQSIRYLAEDKSALNLMKSNVRALASSFYSTDHYEKFVLIAEQILEQQKKIMA